MKTPVKTFWAYWHVRQKALRTRPESYPKQGPIRILWAGLSPCGGRLRPSRSRRSHKFCCLNGALPRIESLYSRSPSRPGRQSQPNHHAGRHFAHQRGYQWQSFNITGRPNHAPLPGRDSRRTCGKTAGDPAGSVLCILFYLHWMGVVTEKSPLGTTIPGNGTILCRRTPGEFIFFWGAAFK
jgi:hypothetical protein